MKGKKGLLLVGILLLGIGFAAVSTTLYLNGNVNISANSEDFDVKFTKAVIDSVDNTSTAISEDGKTITYTTKELQVLNDKSVLDFEVTNNSSLYDAEVSIECTSGEKGDYYQITKEVANIIPAKTTDKGKVEVQKIKVTTDDIEEAFTCTLVATAKERTTKDESTPGVNKNIVNSNIECLQNKEAGSCAPGTEIRYMVNDRDEKTFYVLHDDGETLTLQQRENTIGSTKWYADSNDNTKGPLTVLPVLETATDDWNNVNTLNYIMGTTTFKDNAFTGCNDTLSCTVNTYTLGSRSAKARMITVQETAALGCTSSSQSCPNWMNNYLSDSINYGGTINYGSDLGYWTMSADNSRNNAAWIVHLVGNINSFSSLTTSLGVRAVIEINK